MKPEASESTRSRFDAVLGAGAGSDGLPSEPTEREKADVEELLEGVRSGGYEGRKAALRALVDCDDLDAPLMVTLRRALSRMVAVDYCRSYRHRLSESVFSRGPNSHSPSGRAKDDLLVRKDDRFEVFDAVYQAAQEEAAEDALDAALLERLRARSSELRADGPVKKSLQGLAEEAFAVGTGVALAPVFSSWGEDGLKRLFGRKSYRSYCGKYAERAMRRDGPLSPLLLASDWREGIADAVRRGEQYPLRNRLIWALDQELIVREAPHLRAAQARIAARDAERD